MAKQDALRSYESSLYQLADKACNASRAKMTTRGEDGNGEGEIEYGTVELYYRIVPPPPRYTEVITTGLSARKNKGVAYPNETFGVLKYTRNWQWARWKRGRYAAVKQEAVKTER
ncbi:hypothetical protein EAI_06804 [Harpegnathos saltator]|uniref:Uncharacterized protein n=1 Tax=Harpegnathos saltator TaxID=610380 RepID=E2BB34_HARSA|nr:hypothetical protein EAI_06804 [Harpegnathos saltator]